jgi:hypothetical protein
MSEWTIASRMRRLGVCMALPIALAGVSAQAADAMTFPTPTNATQLFNDVTTANSTPGFNVIPLGDFLYQPDSTQSMVITGNLEITGPPQLQPAQFTAGQAPEITGQNQVSSLKPLFTIGAGANVILKGFNLTHAGGTTFPAISIGATNANLEVDNMALAGNIGNGINIAAGNVTLNNSTVANSDSGAGNGSGIANNGGNLTLNNASIVYNSQIGVSGSFAGHNTLFSNNNGGDCSGAGATTDVNNEDDDFSCNVADGGGAPNTQQSSFNGGPVLSNALGAGSDAATAGATSWCQRGDARFFTNSGSTCSIGAYQANATPQSDTAGPTCLAGAINESSNPSVASTAQASATDAGVGGLAADAIGNPTVVLKGTSTGNGTIAFPTVSGTLFDLTAPGTNILDQQSSSPFTVTASKSVGDVTAHDTFWSFTATDWLNNTTLCQ